MSLLFMDSFDHYATADLTEKWSGTVGFFANYEIGAYGRNGTNGARFATSSWTSGIYATVLGGVNEVIIGVAVKPVFSNQSISFLTFGSGTSWECGVAILSDLTLRPFVVNFSQFNPGDTGYFTLLGSASSSGLQIGVWSYLEVRMKCDGSVGTCTIRINGIEVLAATGLDTLFVSNVLTRFALAGKANDVGQYYVDDVVVMDINGAVNNDFLGDVTVSAIYPNGAGSNTGWTPSAGANFECVDEAVVNDDTDYNVTDAIDAKDTYAMGNCPVGADIRAVQLVAAVRKGTEGPGRVKLVTRSDGTDYDGAEQGIGSSSYAFLREIQETDPATDAAWLEAGFNAAEFGIKKTG